MDELAAINEAIRLRGMFVQRYAGVEYAVAALILHAQQHEAYTSHKGLPLSWSGSKGKVARLHKLLALDGPLAQHRDDLGGYLASFAELDERRNFLVYGIMTADRLAGPDAFRFRMFRSSTDGTDYGLMSATLSEMEALVEAVQPIATSLTALVGRIFHTLSVPPIVAMFDPSAPAPFGLKLGTRL